MDVYEGTIDPMSQRELQGQDHKEELPDPAHQDKPSLKAFLTCIMEGQLGELAWRILGPTTYLMERRFTQNFEVV